MYDIFGVLEYGSIVAADADRGLVITYNGSCTFNVWLVDGYEFEPIECFTRDGATASTARAIAAEWLDACLGGEP
jgi:hypothetical protein